MLINDVCGVIVMINKYVFIIQTLQLFADWKDVVGIGAINCAQVR